VVNVRCILRPRGVEILKNAKLQETV